MVRSFSEPVDAPPEHEFAMATIGVAVATPLPGPIVSDLPNLPPGYVPRTSDIAALKPILLGSDAPTNGIGRTRAVGLFGADGIGKTILATALVRDDDIRNAFSYAIIWLALGPNADVVTQLSLLARAVTGRTVEYTITSEARSSLAHILGNRRLLVVLDDVCSTAVADGFSGLAPGCQLLITTRNKVVLDWINSYKHAVGPLHPSEARATLAGTLGFDDITKEVSLVTRACNGLPLAIAAVASIIRRRGWGHIRRPFMQNGHNASLESEPPETEQAELSAILSANIEALSDIERACLLECAPWPEGVPIPLSALSLYWSAYGSDAFNQEEIVDNLVDASVLHRGTAETLYIHRTYHEYLRRRAGEALTAMHGAVVDRCVRFTGFGYELINRSEWTLAHLPWHLVQASRREHARTLISSYLWLRLKLAAVGARSAIVDTQLIEDDSLRQLGYALHISSHALVHNPNQIDPQWLRELDRQFIATIQSRLTQGVQGTMPYALSPRVGEPRISSRFAIAIWDGHKRGVEGVQLLPDGQHALSWSHDGTLRHCYLNSRKARVFQGHDGPIGGVLLLPDKRHALSWSHDKTLRLWDLNVGTARIFSGHNNWVLGALLLPDGQRAVSWSADGTLRLWDLDIGAIREFSGHSQTIRGALSLPDEERVLSWADDGTLRLWDLNVGTARIFSGHNNWVLGALLLPDGRRALSWSADETLRLWDLDTGALRIYRCHDSWVVDILLLPDGRRVLSWLRDHTLRLWDLNTGTVRTFSGHEAWIEGVLVLPDGRRALSWSGDKTLRLWNLDNGMMQVFRGHDSWVLGVIMLPNGRHVLSWSADRTLRLWDLDGGQEVDRYFADSIITRVLILYDRQMLLVGDIHGRLLFFDLMGWL